MRYDLEIEFEEAVRGLETTIRVPRLEPCGDCNGTGAEEFYRVQDRAVLVRVPAGPYLRRPYEGAGTTVDPDEVEVGSFLIDKYEVTNTRFARFLNAVAEDDRLVDPRVSGIERGSDGAWRASAGRENHPVPPKP